MGTDIDVFISYAREDAGYVDHLTEHLANEGLAVWTDRSALQPGERYVRATRSAIERCGAFVLVMSRASEESHWVEDEVAWARDHGRRVFGLLLSGDHHFGLAREHNEDVRTGALPTPGFVQAVIDAVRGAHEPELGQPGAAGSAPRDLLPRAARPPRRDQRALVGRERELSMLLSLVERLGNRDLDLSEISQFVLVSGPSGVGKSALVAAVVERASSAGWQVASVACEPFHEGMSFFPIRELMRQLSHDSDFTSEVTRMYGRGSSHAQHAAVAEQPDAEPGQRRDALLATFSNIVFGRFRDVRSAPLLLVLDDLERIDVGTADALMCLLSRLGEGRVLVIGLYRSDFVEPAGRSHPIVPLIGAVRRLPSEAIELVLTPLGRDELPDLVGALVEGGAVLPASFHDRLFHETEGNPLFVREVLRSLQQEGSNGAILSEVGGRWKVARKDADWSIPRSIEDAIRTRLDVLDEREREELEHAAVIGRRFAFEVVARLSDSSETELLDALERFIDFDLLQELPGSVELFEFTHGKIRDVLYNAMSRLRRRRLHGRVADVLREVRPLLSEDWQALLAEHLFRAARMAEAFPLLLRSADELTRLHAGQEAANQLERALEAGDAAGLLSNPERIDLQLRRVGALKLANEYEKAAALAAEVAEDPGASDVVRGWALDHLGDIRWAAGDVSMAEQIYLEAEHCARRSGDAALLLEVVADLAEMHEREAERLAGRNAGRYTFHRDEGDAYLDEQLRLSAHSSDTQARARALRNSAKRRRRSGDLAGSIALYEDAIALGDPRVATHQILISYAKTLRLAGRGEDARVVVNRVLDWSAQTGVRRSLGIAHQYRALLLLEQHPPSLAAAEADLEKALALHAEIGYTRGEGEAATVMGEVALIRGEPDEMVRWFRRASAPCDDMSDTEVVSAVVATLSATDEVGRADRIRTGVGASG